MEDGVTVIQEIANQLGMAVDAAGNFIAEQLPAFAMLQVINNSVPLCIIMLIFLSSLVGTVICFKQVNKEEEIADSFRKERKELAAELSEKTGDEYLRIKIKRKYNDVDNLVEKHDKRGFYFGVCLLVFLVICFFACLSFFIALGTLLPKIIGWACVPNAMLIQEALQMIGK